MNARVRGCASRVTSASQDFVAVASADPVNAALLSRLPLLGLDQCYLTAGCLFQAAWNRRSGRPAGWGVKDYDVFYFDPDDLSWEAEDRVIQRVQGIAGDLGAIVEVKNQARVHLWYEKRFGHPYPRLASATDGIDRYLILCTCIGIDVATGELYAPNGLGDVEAGILRINPLSNERALFEQKAAAYQARWPWLSVMA